MMTVNTREKPKMNTKKLRLILAGLTLSFGAVHSYADDAKKSMYC
jgi:hypothetical protein